MAVSRPSLSMSELKKRTLFYDSLELGCPTKPQLAHLRIQTRLRDLESITKIRRTSNFPLRNSDSFANLHTS